MKWISVTDKVPESNKRVLVFWDDDFYVTEGFFANEEFKFTNISCGCCIGRLFGQPTHWMELPKGPEESK